MKIKNILLLLGILLEGIWPAQSQPINRNDIWPAQWIRAASGPQKDFGVFHFRHQFSLDTIPEKLWVHTSGDNRYQLFVNGQLAALGPQRGDLEHWFYESTDLAPLLQKGKNTLAAVVWNYGANPPDAQFTITTAFVLCADDRAFKSINSGEQWKAIHNPGVMENPVEKAQIGGYYGAGSKERVESERYLWGWQSPDFDSSDWPGAVAIESPKPKKCIWAGRWKLTPSTLPQAERRAERLQAARLAEGVQIPESFPQKPADFTIAAGQKARFVLDQTYETTAYPAFEISGGKNAKITVKYAEAPVIGPLKNRNKGNRNEIEGKDFYGYEDVFMADGGSNRIFAPLWWRAYRYLVISVKTESEPLTFHDIRATYTGYPYQQKAVFEGQGAAAPLSNGQLQRMMEIGTRTARLCSHETIMDCPYYEESQFEGDSRITALVSYTNFGDYTLGKNAIEQFAWSINSEGFLSARYPANSTYYIPNYSLFWIGMLHDYLLFEGEKEFIRPLLPVARSILDYFFRRLRPDGSVSYPDYHNFVDWSFQKGEAPVDENGYAALVDLHFLMALQWAEKLERATGEAYFAERYADQINKTKAVVREKYWSETNGLLSDTPEGEQYSQHTNCMGILTGVLSGDTARTVMEKVLAKPEGMTQATFYWSFYLFEALHQAGLGAQYLHHLDIWEEAMALGVTTWPETGIKSRSECHAWGASPNYHFLKIVAGITPAAEGFKEVKIAPNFGELEEITCTYPHPAGNIQLDLSRKRGKITGTITLPSRLTGTLHWQEKQLYLKEGNNEIKRKGQ